MRTNHARSIIGGLTVLALVAAACTSSPPTEQVAEKGGTLRIQADELPWKSSFGGFDPTVEWFQVTHSFYSNLLMRTLMNFNHRGIDEGGALPIPDLASGPSTVSDDGLTVTYKLREGIMFGPPVDREIVADDIIYAFERLGTPALSADAGSYADYYVPIIEGMESFSEGKADSISGITAPDDHTIEFKLTTPTPDFDQRMALPATGPIPEEVAGCFKQPLEYGQYFVATGPYTIEGMDALDISSCKALKAATPSGFDIDKHMFLVRNPNYDETTSDPAIRSALPDRYEITENTNTADIFDKVEANEVDIAVATAPRDVLQKYATDSELTPLLHIEPDDATWYLTMNLTTPPFDDIHVRKAANFVMDKEGLIRVVGGPSKGIPAEHIIPPNVLNGLLPAGEFDPYPSENHAGDVEAAKAEMALSKYDTDGDGICDAPECDNVLHVTRNTSPYPDMAAVIEDAMAKIGISLRTSEVASFYGEAGDITKNVPFTSGAGWGKDWFDAITFVEPLFSGSTIGPAGNVNLSLVGLTEEKAAELKVTYPEGGVPEVEDEIEACAATPAGTARDQCWADLDVLIMEEIVPWIPWRWSQATHVVSAAVTGFDLDAFATYPSFAHMGVNTALQR